MIDLSYDTPTTEDFLNGVQRCIAQIQEALGDIQYLAKRFGEGNYYMTAEDVQNFLHCDRTEIPNIRRTKGAWSRGFLYKKSDVIDWLESHSVGGKK